MRSLALLVLLGLLFTGCEAIELPGEPARLRLGVLGVEFAEGFQGKENLVLKSTDDENPSFDQALLAKLEGYGAAVEVRAIRGPENLENLEDLETVDMVIRPVISGRLSPTDQTRYGWTHVSSFLFWLAFWYPGMVVEDCEYSYGEDFELRFEFMSGGSERQLLFERPIDAGRLELCFFDRNWAGSWQTFWAIFLPPFSIPDGEDAPPQRSQTITKKLANVGARKLAEFLRTGFEDHVFEEGGGSMKGLVVTFDEATGKLTLRGSVRSQEAPIGKVYVLADNKPLDVAEFVRPKSDGGRIPADQDGPMSRSEKNGESIVEIHAETTLESRPKELIVWTRAARQFSRTFWIDKAAKSNDDSPGK